MSSRGRSLALRTGGTVTLPLLVPSFSSKGFPTYEDEDTGATRSDANRAFVYANQFLEEPFLVSAFDVFHEYIPVTTHTLRGTEVVLVDSGGYEKKPFFDSTEPVHVPYPNPPFDLDDYRSILGSFDSSLPLIAASPDWHTMSCPFGEQIEFAQEFFGDYDFTRSLIIKPSGRAHVRVTDLIPHIADLRAFEVVGAAEKELGGTLKVRLRTVAELRTALDRAELAHIPIHIWGGLDPVITPLYYFAGAELFDGISWLRYAFHKGTAMYRDEWQVLDGGVTRSYTQARMQVWNNNLSELRRLTDSLRMFDASGRTDFSAFDWHGAEFERAFKALKAEIPEIRGGKDGR